MLAISIAILNTTLTDYSNSDAYVGPDIFGRRDFCKYLPGACSITSDLSWPHGLRLHRSSIRPIIRSFFAPWFRKPATWAAWRVFLAVLFGLPIADKDLDLFRRCSGLDAPPSGGIIEAWLVCGRRAGKSFILALIAVYLAVFRDWSEYLAPGERGTVKVIACDRKQARVIHRYCRALLTKVPAIAGLVERDDDEETVLGALMIASIATLILPQSCCILSSWG
jgi:hypothetical protein